MVRYRELRSVRQLETEFLYQVEIVVPPGGLGRQLDAIECWLAANVPRAAFARWGRRRDGKDLAVWGFQSARHHSNLAKHLASLLATRNGAKSTGE